MLCSTCCDDPLCPHAWQPARIAEQNFSALCGDPDCSVEHLYAYRATLLRDIPGFDQHRNIAHDDDSFVRDLDPDNVVLTGTETEDGLLDTLPGIPRALSPQAGRRPATTP